MRAWRPPHSGTAGVRHLAVEGSQLSLCQRANVIFGPESGYFDPSSVTCPACRALIEESEA